MPKQIVPLNFSQGLDTKTDPWQVPFGKFLSLVNTVFDKTGLLKKRNGFGSLTLTTPPSTYLATLNGNLTSIGSTVNAYSTSLSSWITKGTLQPCTQSVLPLVRNNYNQTQADSVVANGMVLTAYTQTITNSSGTPTTQYQYVLADVTTGQNLFAPSSIPLLAGGAVQGSSRVFVVGNFFLIVTPVTVSSSTSLQYVSIPIASPVLSTSLPNVSTAQNVTSELYVPTTGNPGWDGVSVNSQSTNVLVVAYNTTSGAQGVHAASLTAQQISTNTASSTILAFAGATYRASLLSICVDLNSSPFTFYVSFWNASTTNGFTLAVYLGFGTITQKFAPQQIITGVAVANITSSAKSSAASVYYEVASSYPSPISLPSNFINSITVSSSGTVGTAYTLIRSLGLAGKPFIVGSTVYVLCAFQSPYQPTYFLINASLSTQAAPIVVSKLAYQNGNGYLALGLPNVTVTNGVAQTPYLYKDDVQAIAVANNPQQSATGNIYSQAGLNLASFSVATTAIDSAELANNLFITGGYLSQYDGYLPVENNFYLFPDSIGVVASGTTGAMAAQQYYYQVVYEWTDNQGYAYRSAPSIPVPITLTTSNTSVDLTIPTLRLTYKIQSPVKIVIYRWSAMVPVYQQTTSVLQPRTNSTTVDYITYNDGQIDSAITGNNIIYTTGGVVADTNGPSSKLMAIFDSRLWVTDAENPNTEWVSKQVIPGAPVEMSSLFTIYVAPTTGVNQSLGPILAKFPMDDKLIFFFRDGACYINGVGPDNLGTTSVGCSLGNYSQPIFIAGSVGCANQNSIALIPDGLMIQTDKGIWLLGRDLSTSYIGAPVEMYNSSTVTSAQVIPGTNQVRFTLNSNVTLVYDYYQKQWSTFQGVSAVSSCIYNKLHTLLDSTGAILQETPGVYSDKSNPVLMSFKTSWINLNGLQGYQRLYTAYLLARYLSPHRMVCEVAYDYESSISDRVVIQPSNFSSSTPASFGIPVPYGAPADREQWRVDARRQLCESVQFSVKEIFDPTLSSTPGAGFTMSGIAFQVLLKGMLKPASGATSTGL